MRSALILLLLLAAARTALAQMAVPAPDCSAEAAAAEQQAGVPAGLLAAIGRVESGRWNAATGRVDPWPWTINVGGAGRFFATRDEAVAATAQLLAAGFRSIDAGCFQVNLLYHPDAFRTLGEAFDPAANAGYAARFLASLYGRTGSWAAAAALYHSAIPGLGGPYRDAVLSAWRARGPGAPPWPAVPDEGVVIAGVRVFMPGTSARPASIESASQGITIARGRALPRVFTPSSSPAVPTLLSFPQAAAGTPPSHGITSPPPR